MVDIYLYMDIDWECYYVPQLATVQQKDHSQS